MVMAFHSPVHSPAAHTLAMVRWGILLAVILTALLSALLVQSQWERYEIYPEQIPIADQPLWKALGH
jgi:hypothetical protein